jgi:APA family basic amino acid/polyamine antiporter
VTEHAETLAEGTPLTRGIGPWQATALNITMIVGAGVFATIPLMLGTLPGPYAVLGWLAAGALILVDGLIWSELGATMPGSGGSYQYLLECYGRERWGRLFAFLFIWQFLLSGPLELGSGLVALSQFSASLSPEFHQFDEDWTWKWVLWEDQEVAMSFGPARLIGFLVGVGIVGLLYRNITTLGRLTVTIWLGVLATIAWILVEGWIHFDAARAFAFSGPAAAWPAGFGWKLGPVMILAMYSYLGYYNVCYIGDEVRDPGRTIPRAIVWSAVIVCVLFTGLHLAMLGVVPWQEVPTKETGNYSLAAVFMDRIHGPGSWAATLITLLLIWCCFGSVFAGLLGYSRIPFGAARQGHFFRVFAQVHPRERIPHVSLFLIGGLTLFWSFFDLSNVISALIVTRLLEQFVAQAVGVVLLRRLQPDRPRPYRMWLYPLPCFLALVGWLYLYVSAPPLYMVLGAGTLIVGIVVFLLWSRHTASWPFQAKKSLDG